jgi:hypothetical protein
MGLPSLNDYLVSKERAGARVRARQSTGETTDDPSDVSPRKLLDVRGDGDRGTDEDAGEQQQQGHGYTSSKSPPRSSRNTSE